MVKEAHLYQNTDGLSTTSNLRIIRHCEPARLGTLYAELRHTECAYYFECLLIFRIHYKRAIRIIIV